jgi:CheY-like chemotaxis protein
VQNQYSKTNPVANGRLPPGDYVCIGVADDGAGIPKKLLANVMEPLVTTKAPGRGSGLGLSMVQRFSQNAGGTLTIESTEGSGTTVTIWLPRDRAPAEMTANMTLPLSTLAGGSECVLLALDDTDVRTAVQQILEAVGYRVIVNDGQEPVSALSKPRSQPAVVLCDRSIERSEQERNWLDALRRCCPSIKHLAILAPGTNVAAAAADADAFLYRPIGVLELTRAMRTALEAE